MAKKIQIDIEVNGKMQKATVSAKKLQSALSGADKAAAGLSNSAHNADRRLKGAAQASANGTKNFSKMAQGISGGLVPAYATLAAQVFAVTAVFQFLRSASDTANLIAGQQALAATTGVAYKTITNSIKEATAGQISYAEASRAAAIGSAAGLSPDQLNRLGAAAKNVSVALGRDLTDSFNRLIRGVTKAEPELLDELGIILRLDPATERYARQIGKAQSELDEFERSQAVANEVLRQAEEKFGALEALLDPSTAALNRFITSFDTLINKVKIGVIDTIRPLLDFLSNNTSALAAALTLFALPIVRSILPSFKDWKADAVDTINIQNAKLKELKTNLGQVELDLQKVGKSQTKVLKNASKMAGGALTGAGISTAATGTKFSGVDFLLGRSDTGKAAANADKILSNAEAQLKNHTNVQTGTLKGANAQQLADLRKSYDLRTQVLQKHGLAHASAMDKMELHAQKALTNIEIRVGKFQKFMAAASLFIARAFNFASMAVGIIGLITILYQFGRAVYLAFNPAAAEAEALKKKIEGATDSIKQLNEELGNTITAAAGGILDSGQAIVAIGNAVNSANLGNLVSQYMSLTAETKNAKTATADNIRAIQAFQAETLTTFKNLAKLDNRFAKFGLELYKTGKLSYESSQALEQLANEFIRAQVATEQLPRNIAELNRQLTNLFKSYKGRNPLEGLLNVAGRAASNARISADAQFGQFASAEKAKKVAREDLRVLTDGTSSLVQTGDMTPETQEKVLAAARERVQLADALYHKMFISAKEAEKMAQEQETFNQFLVDAVKAREDEFTAIGELATKRQNLQSAGITFEQKANNLRARELQDLEKLREAEYARNVLQDIKNTGLKDGKALTDEQLQAITQELADSKLTVQELKNKYDITVDQVELQLKLNDLARQQNEIARDMKPLQLQQELVDMAERRAGYAKTILDAEDKIGMNAIAQRDRDAKRADPMGFDFDREKRRRIEELAHQEAMGIKRKEMIDAEKLIKDEQIRLETDMLLLRINAAELELEAARARLEQEVTPEERGLFEAQRGMAETVEEGALAANEASAEAAKSDVDDKIDKAKEGVEAMDEFNQVFEGLGEKLSSGMADAFMSIMDGTKSVKEAFGQMAKAIIADIMRMIIKLLIQKAIMAAMGMAEGGVATPSGPKLRYGGIVKPRGYRYGGYTEAPQMAAIGGVFKGPSAGYPVIMHGTEAVVPLPNGREIPVEMKGGGGQNNNVTVNVAMDSAGGVNQTQSNNGQQAAQLGNMVAAAVQRELQNQKRAGGILSPYGAA